MKLIWYELRKIISAKAFVGITCLCICTSLLYQLSETLPNRKLDKYNGMRGSCWERVIDKIDTMTDEQKVNWLTTEALYYGYMAYVEVDYQGLDGLIEEFKEIYPEVDLEGRIAQKGGNISDTMSYLNMHKLCNNLMERIKYIDSYPSFLESIQQKADELEDISLFADIEGFGSKNVIKTANAYAKLNGIELDYDFSAALYMGSNTTLVDMMILFVVILIGWQVFCKEREKGLFLMLRTAKEGRLSLILAKIIAFFIAVSATALVMYGSQFVLGFIFYGVGNLNAALQSLSEYRNCALKVTIGEYVILFLALKALAAAVLGSIAMLFMVRLKAFVPAVCVYFALLTAEYALYSIVDTLSAWNWLRYVNLFAILDADETFTVYRNLNLFSNPVWTESAKLLLCVSLVIVSSVISALSFCAESLGAGIRSKKRVRGFELFKLGRHASLFTHEGFKLYVLSGMIIFALLAVFVSCKMSEGIVEYTGIAKIQSYRYYIELLEGVYTDEKEEFIKNENELMQMIDEEARLKQEQLEKGELSQEDYDSWYQKRQQIITMRSEGFSLILEQQQCIQQSMQKGKAGFADRYQLEYLFQDDDNQVIFTCVLLTAIIIGVSGLFGIENRNGMEPLLNSTLSGRRRVWSSKLMQAVIGMTIIFLVIYIPYYTKIWMDMSRVDADLLLNCVPDYRSFEPSLSIRQSFAIMVILKYITAIAAVLITAAAARLIKNQALSSVLCFILLLGPCILYLWDVDLSSYSFLFGFLPELVFRSGELKAGLLRFVCIALIGVLCIWISITGGLRQELRK